MTGNCFSRSEGAFAKRRKFFKQPHHWRTKGMGQEMMLNILNISGLTPKAGETLTIEEFAGYPTT